MVIAIDGPASGGKGTLAKMLAERLDFAHLDTGKLYRATGYAVLESGGNPNQPADALRGAKIIGENLTAELLANPELRGDKAGEAASQVAVFPDVREILLEYQRKFFKNPPGDARGVILDGRDIGTVMFPDADIKLFVTADVEARAARRTQELQDLGIAASYNDVLEDMKRRDVRDSTRDAAPMTPAEDAFVINTTSLTKAEMLDQALALIRARLLIS